MLLTNENITGFLRFKSLDSTNDMAKRIADNGIGHGTIIIADSQTNGRGRKGKKWISESGNLYMSAILEPDINMAISPQLSFVTSLAIRDVLKKHLSKQNIELKWPNDVLIDRKKISGILIESYIKNNKQYIIIGIGVNVNSFPMDIDYPAISLYEYDVKNLKPAELASDIVDSFFIWYDRWLESGFAPIRESWLKNTTNLGKKIEVTLRGESVQGKFSDMGIDGSLILELEDGSFESIQSGEIRL